MTPHFKLALTSLLALALGALGTWLLTREASTPGTDLRNVEGEPRPGGPVGTELPGGALDSGTLAGPGHPIISGNSPQGPEAGGSGLVGARLPHGVDLSQPAARAKALGELLGALDVDWAAVAELLALMEPGEKLDPAVADALLNGLRSDRRNMALLAFARLKDGSLVPDLFDLHADASAPPGVRAAALRALWEMPGADAAEVVRGLESLLGGSPDDDRELLYAIARRGGAEGARAILQYLERTPDLARIPDHVLQQLDLNGSDAARDALRVALQAPKSPEIAERLLAIVAFQQAQGLTAQVIAFDSDAHSDALRRRALEALRQIGDQQAIEHLLALSRQPGTYGEVALQSLADLRRADAAGRQSLLKALEQAGLAARPDALREGLLLALGSVEHSAAVPVVAGYLGDGSPAVRSAAVRSLGRMGPRAREQAAELVRLWTSADETLRRDLAIAVSSIGGETAIQALTLWVKDPALSPNLQRTLHVGLRSALDGSVSR